MLIGCPKEIKPQEYRVGLTPNAVKEIILNGHKVLIEKDAGAGSGFPDQLYEEAGAKILQSAEEICLRNHNYFLLTSIWHQTLIKHMIY